MANAFISKGEEYDARVKVECGTRTNCGAPLGRDGGAFRGPLRGALRGGTF